MSHPWATVPEGAAPRQEGARRSLRTADEPFPWRHQHAILTIRFDWLLALPGGEPCVEESNHVKPLRILGVLHSQPWRGASNSTTEDVLNQGARKTEP